MFCKILAPIIPLPHPTSKTVGFLIDLLFKYSIIISTKHSVSWRGINTESLTINEFPKNSLNPKIYAKGSWAILRLTNCWICSCWDIEILASIFVCNSVRDIFKANDTRRSLSKSLSGIAIWFIKFLVDSKISFIVIKLLDFLITFLFLFLE